MSPVDIRKHIEGRTVLARLFPGETAGLIAVGPTGTSVPLDPVEKNPIIRVLNTAFAPAAADAVCPPLPRKEAHVPLSDRI